MGTAVNPPPQMPSLFFQLLQQTDAPRPALERPAAEAEWQETLSQARRQTLTGIMFATVSRLPDGQRPPRGVLLQWFAESERIRAAARRVNRRAAELTARFAQEEVRSIVLKGQGVAMLYPDPLLRMPGDIDLWPDAPRATLFARLRRRFPMQAAVYHNMSCPFFPDVAVEVHFTPSWMNRPCANRRLQRFFRREAAAQRVRRIPLPEGAGEICVPTDAFNRVYLLVHIYRHLFGEGIGLRQLMDYHYLLLAGCTDDERRATLHDLSQLGLAGFARAVMYVLHRVFATPADRLLTAPDEREGRFLLREVMLAGNFGHHDPRNRPSAGEGDLRRFFRLCGRNLRFLRYHPGETLCTPLFKIWHRLWRLRHGYVGAPPSA